MEVGLRYSSCMRLVAWFRRWRPEHGPGEDERRALEHWVRRRFQMASPDAMDAIIGAVGRLTEAGMSQADAAETVVRVVKETTRDPDSDNDSGHAPGGTPCRA